MTIRVFASGAERGQLALPPDESHYLVRVRRASVGDMIEVLSPNGGGWRATVDVCHPRQAQLTVHEPLPPRPPGPVALAVGLPDAKAAYEVVARATESGARALTFLDTQRSQPTRLKPDRVQRVIASARRQSGRLDLLDVDGPVSLQTWLSSSRNGYFAAFAESAPPHAPCSGELDVLIGPEGGLHPDEERAAIASGLHPMSLGPFVLRTEIAVTAALAITTARNSPR